MRQISEITFPQDWHESCLWQKRTYIYVLKSVDLEKLFSKEKIATAVHHRIGRKGAFDKEDAYIESIGLERLFFLTLPKHLPHRIGRKVDFGKQDTYIEVSRFGEVVFFD